MDQSVDLQLLLEASQKPAAVKVVSKTIEEQERLKTIMETAYQYALKKGLESEMRVIRSAVVKNERNLDAIYNYGPLMIHDRVVPPVITEARNIIQNKSFDNLKTTNTIYKIEKQAYFSTLPPNWRTELSFPESNYTVDLTESPTKDLMPKGSAERKVWDETLVKGFRDGQKQAQQMFRHALNKLTTEYVGRIRFHQFVLEGKVSMPSITKRDLAISSTKDLMMVDQRLLQIRTLPSFDGNMLHWNTWIQPVEQNPSKQAYTINSAE